MAPPKAAVLYFSTWYSIVYNNVDFVESDCWTNKATKKEHKRICSYWMTDSIFESCAARVFVELIPWYDQ